jgi:hypothetical protein
VTCALLLPPEGAFEWGRRRGLPGDLLDLLPVFRGLFIYAFRIVGDEDFSRPAYFFAGSAFLFGG